MFSAKIDGANTVHALQALSGDIADAVRRQLYQGIERARQRAFDTTAFQDRTCELRSTLMARLNINPASYDASLFALAKHARFIEEGTKAHDITAKRGGLLKFQINGRWISKRSVRHPGTKATHFMQRAVEDEATPTRDALESDIGHAIRRFNG